MTTYLSSEPVAHPPDHRRWWLLAAMCTAQFMLVLDDTIVNVALPQIQRDLGVATADRQWVVTAYALAFGGLLLIGGRVADLIGRRTAVLAGLTGFAFASALGGVAVSLPVLVLARVAQGAFAALLAPAALAVITTTFVDQRDRHRAFGVFGTVSAGGAAAGLLLGGALTEYASWRWTLLVNTLLAAIAVLGVLATLGRQPRVRGSRPDLAGSAAVTLGLCAVVYGCSHAYEQGWLHPVTLGCLVGGVGSLALFGLIERRVDNPLLPPRILASRVRAGSLLVLFLSNVTLFAELFFLTFYLQDDLGFTPVQAGLAFLPQTAAVVVASLGSAIVLRHVSARPAVAGAMATAAAGTVWLTRIDAGNRYVAVVLPGVLLIGAGLGLGGSIATNLGVHGVREVDTGVSSAVVNAVQQLGGSIGPALFNTVAGSLVAAYLATHRQTGGAAGLAAIHSYTVVFAIAACVLAAAAAAALLTGPARRREITIDPARHQQEGARSVHINRSTDEGPSERTASRPPEPTFTGDVVIDGYFRRQTPSRLAGARVEFGPGARTPWKTNPAGQTVVVTSGAGLAGSEEGGVVAIAAGDVLWFAPGEQHWEGASPDSAMTCVALQEEGDAGSVRFGEPVTDEQYAERPTRLIRGASSCSAEQS